MSCFCDGVDDEVAEQDQHAHKHEGDQQVHKAYVLPLELSNAGNQH